MEGLVRIALAILVASFVGLIAGLYLLHDAINSGNVWQGIAAFVMCGVCGVWFVGAAGCFR